MRGKTETWTIRRIMQWMQSDFAAKGIDSARLDAELLLADALGLERIQLYLDLERPLRDAELAEVKDRVRRRREREPVAYILGERGFWGRLFDVGPAVLIPRPDTETLVERALEILEPGHRVLDLCTGSGCIAVTLAAERELAVEATDVSAQALEIARKNATKHEVEVRFHEGDLFAGAEGVFDLITANPPYVTQAELGTLEDDVARFEPELALVSGESGFELIERIASRVFEHLAPGGTLLMEVGEGQAGRTSTLFRDAGLVDVRTHLDLAKIERVVEGRKPDAT